MTDIRWKKRRPCADAVAGICEYRSHVHIQVTCSLHDLGLKKSTSHFDGRTWTPEGEFAGDCDGRLRESRGARAVDDVLALRYGMGQREIYRPMKSLRLNRMKGQPAPNQKSIWVQRLLARRVSLRVTC